MIREERGERAPPTWIADFLHKHTGLLLEYKRAGASVLWVYFRLCCTTTVSTLLYVISHKKKHEWYMKHHRYHLCRTSFHVRRPNTG